MKITAYLGALVLLLSLSVQSCKKHNDEPKITYQTIDVVLDANKSYQYSFGEGNTNLAITKQAQAYTLSEIDKSGSASVLNYTPKSGFTGTDEIEVTLSNGKVAQQQLESTHTPVGSCQHPNNGGNKSCGQHHDCNKHHDDKTIYTFKITIHQTAAAQITRVSNLHVGTK